MTFHSEWNGQNLKKKQNKNWAGHVFRGHPGSIFQQFFQRVAVGKTAMSKIRDYKYLGFKTWYAWERTILTALIIHGQKILACHQFSHGLSPFFVVYHREMEAWAVKKILSAL